MFTVRFVSEDALPEGHTYVIGITDDGHRFLFVKHGAVSSSVIEEAWAAGMVLNNSTPPLRVAV